MNVFGLVSRYVDRQKDELMHHLLARNAVAPERAIDLSAFPIKRAILQEMINRKIVLRAPSGKFYLDPYRMNRAYGASGKFILYAIGVMVLFILVIALL